MTLRVGVIGCGYIGNKRLDLAKRDEGTTVEMVADIEADKAAMAAKTAGCRQTTDWREVVSDDNIDIVVVSTTNDLLAPITMEALKSGKHVLCEKPMARNSAEAAPLVELADKKRRVLKVGFNLRFHPAIAKAHQLLEEGIVGKPIFARCSYGHGGRPGYDKEWRSIKEISGGGELLDQGVHIADLFNWFFGQAEEIVGFNACGYWHAEDIEDNGFALFKTAENVISSMHVSCTQWKNLFSFELSGSKGHLRIEGLGGSYGPERLAIGIGAGKGKAPFETTIEFSRDDVSWRLEWCEFISSVLEDRVPIGSGKDAYNALRAIDAIYESSAKKEVIEFESDGAGSRKRKSSIPSN